MNTEKYPLQSIGQAFKLVRNHKISDFRSKEINPDRVQISPQRYQQTYRSPCGEELIIDFRSFEDALMVQVIFALQAVIGAYPKHSPKRRAFLMCTIGERIEPDYTGDYKIFTYREAQAEIGAGYDKIRYWVRTLKEEFEEELQRRGLLQRDTYHDRNN